MYPVYDLSTEGGQKAFLQHLGGHNALGGSYVGFDGQTTQCLLRVANQGSVLPTSKSKSIAQALQEMTPDSPVEEFIANFNQEARDALSSCITDYFSGFGVEVEGGIVVLSPIDLVYDFGTGVLRGWVDGDYKNASFDLVLADDYPSLVSSNHTISVRFKSRVDVDEYYYDRTLIRDNDTGDVVALNIDQFLSPWFRINQFVFYSHDVDDGQNGSPLEQYSIEPFGMLIGTGASRQGSAANYAGDIGPHGYVSFEGATPDYEDTYVFKVIYPGAYEDGDTLDLESLKSTFPDYDWDHPITEPYPEGEPVGLTATRKHFIRIS